MARAAQEKVYADFSGGYLTEGNQLSYPENAASEMINFDLKENGSVARRLGLGYEDTVKIPMPAPIVGYVPATNTFEWENVNGDPSVNLMVVQVGDRLDFFNSREDGITSQSFAAPSITLVPISGGSQQEVYSSDITAISGAGVLFIAGEKIEPSYLSFSSGVVTRNIINMRMRDFSIWKEGEFELDGTSLAGEVRQSTMSAYHQYNMYNQGWPDGRDTGGAVGEISISLTIPDNGNGDAYPGLPLYETNRIRGFYPTTANLFHSYQSGAGNTKTKQTAYDMDSLRIDREGNTATARGHSILDVFRRKREGKGSDNITKWEVVSTNHRPTSVAFYAGRVWYAGTKGKSFSSEIYFSQTIGSSLEKAGNCFQEADPTAEIINELVATDGGVLNINEMGSVVGLYTYNASLLVVTTNGVWAISGDGEFSSFTATNFTVKKLTDKSALSRKSVVVAKDAVYYLGVTSVYRIAADPTAGNLSVSDISSASIKTFYQNLSSGQKRAAFSVYDEASDKVLWYYPTTVETTTPQLIPSYDKALYIDLSLQAFGKYELSTDANNIPIAGVSTDISTKLTITNAVLTNLDNVVVGTDAVKYELERYIEDRSSVKYLVLEDGATNYRFADYRDNTYKDFDMSFESVLETGFDSISDIMRAAKKAPIAVFHLSRTEDGFEINPSDPDMQELILKNPSSCMVSYKWDWGERPFSNEFQAYKLLKNYTPSGASDPFSYDRHVITTKNRLRGRGMSIGFRIRSEEGKDLRLLGYGILFTTRDTI